MDITIELGEHMLNVRAAVTIIHNNKILVHKNVNKDHYALPGGRVAVGEDSKETVKREIKEELCKEIEIESYIATVENFFKLEGKKYHEILFIHKGEFVEDEDKKIEYTLHNKEGKDYLQYEWLDLNKIEEYNIVPVCIKNILLSKNFPVHIINNEIKNEQKILE